MCSARHWRANATLDRGWPIHGCHFRLASTCCRCAGARKCCAGCSSRWDTRLRPPRCPLDEQFPEWGDSPYFTVTIRGTTTLRDLLVHLYVLIPVFDNHKHYFVGDDELEKLLKKGDGWLTDHPEKEEIARRYLKFRPSLFRTALARLAEADETTDDEIDAQPRRRCRKWPRTTAQSERAAHRRRVGGTARDGGEARLDLGCGEGKLLRELLQDRGFTKIVGLDVSVQSLQRAGQRLGYDRLPSAQRERVELIHGSLMYRDRRLEDFDAAAVVEVIEHLDPPRLKAFERVLFEFARPRAVVLTTPNSEYNVMWETLPAGKLRHADHRFEWTREQFQQWAPHGRAPSIIQSALSPSAPKTPRSARPRKWECLSVPDRVHHHANLIYSPGTQIVSLVEVCAQGTRTLHPRGAVAVIVKSPADVSHSYRVRFLDGYEAALKPGEVMSLAQFKAGEIGDTTRSADQSNLFERVIYRCVIGSQAYGLAGEASDIDRRGIYLPHAEVHWSLYGVPEQLENNETQEAYWEIQKFLILALKANPNVLECLFTPLVETATPLAEELRAMRSIFLSRLVYQTYNGYVMSQFKKMQTDLRNQGEFKWKHVMHLIRLLLSGIEVLRTGTLSVRVDAHRDELLTIRRGEMPWDQVEEWRRNLHNDFDAAYAETALPERPDYERANTFLIEARRRALRDSLP